MRLLSPVMLRWSLLFVDIEHTEKHSKNQNKNVIYFYFSLLLCYFPIYFTGCAYGEHERIAQHKTKKIEIESKFLESKFSSSILGNADKEEFYFAFSYKLIMSLSSRACTN